MTAGTAQGLWILLFAIGFWTWLFRQVRGEALVESRESVGKAGPRIAQRRESPPGSRVTLRWSWPSPPPRAIGHAESPLPGRRGHPQP